MKKLLSALSVLLLPTAAIADENLYMFGATGDLSDYDSVLFDSAIHALQDVCMETEDPSMIAICNNSDDAIDAITDNNIFLDVRQMPK